MHFPILIFLVQYRRIKWSIRGEVNRDAFLYLGPNKKASSWAYYSFYSLILSISEGNVAILVCMAATNSQFLRGQTPLNCETNLSHSKVIVLSRGLLRCYESGFASRTLPEPCKSLSNYKQPNTVDRATRLMHEKAYQRLVECIEKLIQTRTNKLDIPLKPQLPFLSYSKCHPTFPRRPSSHPP